MHKGMYLPKWNFGMEIRKTSNYNHLCTYLSRYCRYLVEIATKHKRNEKAWCRYKEYELQSLDGSVLNLNILQIGTNLK